MVPAYAVAKFGTIVNSQGLLYWLVTFVFFHHRVALIRQQSCRVANPAFTGTKGEQVTKSDVSNVEMQVCKRPRWREGPMEQKKLFDWTKGKAKKAELDDEGRGRQQHSLLCESGGCVG